MTDEDIRRIQKEIIKRVTLEGDAGVEIDKLFTQLEKDGVGTDMEIREAHLYMGTTTATMGILMTSDRRLRVMRPNEHRPPPYDFR